MYVADVGYKAGLAYIKHRPDWVNRTKWEWTTTAKAMFDLWWANSPTVELKWEQEFVDAFVRRCQDGISLRNMPGYESATPGEDQLDY